ncbi:MAG: hypothetical protein GY820_00025, partial [Gammaproteobacteria bacterium]|nr:hypothetical protein [Gammaproteobacteria bacterium]
MEAEGLNINPRHRMFLVTTSFCKDKVKTMFEKAKLQQYKDITEMDRKVQDEKLNKLSGDMQTLITLQMEKKARDEKRRARRKSKGKDSGSSSSSESSESEDGEGEGDGDDRRSGPEEGKEDEDEEKKGEEERKEDKMDTEEKRDRDKPSGDEEVPPGGGADSGPPTEGPF